MNENLKIPLMKTVVQAAEMTGLATYQIRQLVLNNKVRYIKAGSKYLINIDSLIQYLNEGDNYANEGGKENGTIRKII